MAGQAPSKTAFAIEAAMLPLIAGSIFLPALGGDVRSGSKLAFVGLVLFCSLLSIAINRRNRDEQGQAHFGWGLTAFLVGPAAVLFLLAERAAGARLESWVVYPYLALGAFGAVALVNRAGGSGQNSRTIFTVTALVMVWLVAYFSGTTGSPGNFPIFGKGILDWPTVVIITRKTVHVLFYGCFGLVLREVLDLRERNRTSIATILLFTFGLACIDEFRQAAFPDRSGSWMDVMLDTGAAAIFLEIAARRAAKRRPDSAAG